MFVLFRLLGAVTCSLAGSMCSCIGYARQFAKCTLHYLFTAYNVIHLWQTSLLNSNQWCTNLNIRLKLTHSIVATVNTHAHTKMLAYIMYVNSRLIAWQYCNPIGREVRLLLCSFKNNSQSVHRVQTSQNSYCFEGKIKLISSLQLVVTHGSHCSLAAYYTCEFFLGVIGRTWHPITGSFSVVEHTCIR